MKRTIFSAIGFGIGLVFCTSSLDAQRVRVAVGVNAPRVGVRVNYRPYRHYPVRQVYRQVPRRLTHERELARRIERERYRAWLNYEYRRWLRHHRHQHYMTQRVWERRYLRDARRADRDYRRWLRDRERDRRRARGPGRR